MDWPTREGQVQRMQQIFYEEAPYVVLYYPKALIAYNTARWQGWVPYPGDNGMVVFSNDNIDSYVQVHQGTAGDATATSDESDLTALIAGLAVAALAVVAIVLLLRRRGRAVEQ